MNRIRITVASFLAALLASTVLTAEVTITPANPPDLTVRIAAGETALPGGKTVKFEAAQLKFDPPEIRGLGFYAKAPRDFASWYEPWDPWPSKGGNSGAMNTIDLKPHVAQGPEGVFVGGVENDRTRDANLEAAVDEEGTLILGALFRQVISDSVVVTSADGNKTYKMNEDYKYNAEWGQIANLKGGLGEEFKAELKVACKYAAQRLDLVQVGPDGKLSVKKGAPRIVCPELPAPDAGYIGLAGIYIAGWTAADNPNYDSAGGLKAASTYAITPHEILPIQPAPPVAPVNKNALARSVKKLATGGELKIAFMGASVTVGAEAPAWWADLWTEKNLGFPSRVVVELRKRFPKATVTPIAAFQGGTQTKYGLEVMDKTVIPAKADLVLIDFGGNDVSGPIGGKPNNPPEQFKEDMRAMIKKAKDAGMGVLIVVGERSNPWLKPNVFERWPAYRRAMLDVAKEENVAAADVGTEFANQASRGIPPFSQLHNWLNHPGTNGHKIYADVILRCFE